ncbi:MAG: muconolactone Delta-isomerase family protein [Kineosporiaceae bacterium]
MEYLVTMTTHVPEGVPQQTVDTVRAREADRSRELAARGDLLRLWRPPLQPGEWRTLGLFSAADQDRLEEVLVSMPLRIWRKDEVTPLSPHVNDPASPTPLRPAATEFFTVFALTIPDGVDPAVVDRAREAEARDTRALAHEGYLVRLWRLPGDGRALGLWQTEDRGALETILAALPLGPWLDIETVPLTTHPNDPGRMGSRADASRYAV